MTRRKTKSTLFKSDMYQECTFHAAWMTITTVCLSTVCVSVGLISSRLLSFGNFAYACIIFFTECSKLACKHFSWWLRNTYCTCMVYVDLCVAQCLPISTWHMCHIKQVSISTMKYHARDTDGPYIWARCMDELYQESRWDSYWMCLNTNHPRWKWYVAGGRPWVLQADTGLLLCWFT
jgi:hypothetical protein